jgi:type I restriction enzyme S subunit
VKRDWLMMSRSGQVYGLLGSVVIATEAQEGKVVSDDVIRLATMGSIDPGYLYVVMAHATLGRPRVKAMAYGSSIPHIEVEDLKQFRVPRLAASAEAEIGALAREAFSLWARADETEKAMAAVAEGVISNFLATG